MAVVAALVIFVAVAFMKLEPDQVAVCCHPWNAPNPRQFHSRGALNLPASRCYTCVHRSQWIRIVVWQEEEEANTVVVEGALIGVGLGDSLHKDAMAGSEEGGGDKGVVVDGEAKDGGDSDDEEVVPPPPPSLLPRSRLSEAPGERVCSVVPRLNAVACSGSE